MNKQQKFRMKSWYWGNYCVQLECGKWIDNWKRPCSEGTHFKVKELEPYIEEEHGWHHSEEYAKGEDINGSKVKKE